MLAVVSVNVFLYVFVNMSVLGGAATHLFPLFRNVMQASQNESAIVNAWGQPAWISTAWQLSLAY